MPPSCSRPATCCWRKAATRRPSPSCGPRSAPAGSPPRTAASRPLPGAWRTPKPCMTSAGRCGSTTPMPRPGRCCVSACGSTASGPPSSTNSGSTAGGTQARARAGPRRPHQRHRPRRRSRRRSRRPPDTGGAQARAARRGGAAAPPHPRRGRSGRRHRDGGHVVVDEAHHGGALAHGRRAALQRTGPHVTRRVDAGHARFEQPRHACIRPREDEPLLVPGDRRRRASRCTGRLPGRRTGRTAASVSPSVSFTASSRPSLPSSMQISERSRTATPKWSSSSIRYWDIVSRRSARRCSSVTSAPPRASQTAACPAELPPPDDRHPLAAAQLPLVGPGGIEGGDALVLVQGVHGQAPVFGPAREHHRAGRHLVAFLQRDHVTVPAHLAGCGRGRAWPGGRGTCAPARPPGWSVRCR